MAKRNVIEKAFYANLSFSQLDKKRDEHMKKRVAISKRFADAAKKIRVNVASGKDASENQALFGELMLCTKKLDKSARYSVVRKRKFCSITGRKRGLQMGMDRAYLRNMCGFGMISGVKKF